MCNSLNGKHSWWSTGFAYGVWTGVMRALDIEIQARSQWKPVLCFDESHARQAHIPADPETSRIVLSNAFTLECPRTSPAFRMRSIAVHPRPILR